MNASQPALAHMRPDTRAHSHILKNMRMLAAGRPVRFSPKDVLRITIPGPVLGCRREPRGFCHLAS